ncbi:MAG: NAD(P)-binding domain-containing protein [Armatimonadetes bacterium]|nr:NAD(P)-binding domain-containing protein [Armatimonadota bacterium]
MFSLVKSYIYWLHTRWPAGTVERLPEVRPDGSTNVQGVYVTGDLTGVPLLKFSSDSGAKAVMTICSDPLFQKERGKRPGILDLVVIGAGVSGVAAAMEAKKRGLSFEIIEASQPFLTIVNFPKGKPIYTYPRDMRPEGELQLTAEVKEDLVDELYGYLRASEISVTSAKADRIERKEGVLQVIFSDREPLKALRVIAALGRSGNFRRLSVPGEELDKVYNRLHDPKDFAGKEVLVVGGGDTALEAAIALTAGGAHVTLCHRKKEFIRPKPENLEKIDLLVRSPGSDVQVEHPSSERVTTSAGPFMGQAAREGTLQLRLAARVKEIKPEQVVLSDGEGHEEAFPNDAVFSMIGREAPLDFFRCSGIRIRGEWTPGTMTSFAGFFLICAFIYNWKEGAALSRLFQTRRWFPYGMTEFFGSLHSMFSDPGNLLGTIAISLGQPAFYYSVAYCMAVLVFGIGRIRRRKTPYVTAQTIGLILIQWIPLFLLPYLILPWMGHNGFFDSGILKTAADNLFPVSGDYGRQYWTAFGFILAWPLFIWNVFTSQPLWWWLAISLAQTFVIIPLIIWRWGKGAYCGWICTCGALAETMGDAHRAKMPHGPLWNRVNLVGQAVLAAAFVLLALRVASWLFPGGPVEGAFWGFLSGWRFLGIPLNYHWIVDVTMSGIIGVGSYFWASGRVWCRFACPLAALMHIYARFSRFRIFADKKKCISCNVCTSVCHQGIDIMNFANKGVAMEDPECVRCSACVQECPTGVLTFGRLDRGNSPIFDKLSASRVQIREGAPSQG